MSESDGDDPEKGTKDRGGGFWRWLVARRVDDNSPVPGTAIEYHKDADGTITQVPNSDHLPPSAHSGSDRPQ